MSYSILYELRNLCTLLPTMKLAAEVIRELFNFRSSLLNLHLESFSKRIRRSKRRYQVLLILKITPYYLFFET